MKKLMGLLVVTVLAAAATVAYAETATFTLSATVKAITGTSINSSSVDAKTNAFTALGAGNQNFAFGELTLKTNDDGTQRFESSKYFAIDIAGTGGAGVPKTVITYQEGQVQGSTKLGDRAAVVLMAKKYTAPGVKAEEYLIDRKSLTSLVGAGVTINGSQVTALGGNWLRAYVGLNSGEYDGFLPFNPGDAAGTYTGTVTVTATL